MNKIKKLPSVTIHVTVKNAEDTIKNCIDSLLALDYPNKKIYVTEAFSSDSTYEILKDYGKKIKLERVKGNAPTAHNHVFNKISTDFIAFTDADCIADKNWLKNLIIAFKSPDTIAAGGLVKTPRNANKLQQVIGKELKDRYAKFPRFVSRLPTMNLCVRTDVVKKIRMDERFDVAFETDWGYRLTKYGKMVYEPKAIVWHHHRPTLSSFFKQQFNYGKFLLLLYSKNPMKSTGDHISKGLFWSQLVSFSMTVLFLLLSLFDFPYSWIYSAGAAAFFLFLLLTLVDDLRLFKKIDEILIYFILSITRTVAWFLGSLIGLSKLLSKKY